MLDYLIKFNALPQYLKDKMSEPSILNSVKDLEIKYDISLAAVIMKVMVKDISILDLIKFFVFEYHLDGKKAEELVEEMKEKVLFVAADYLGFESKRKKDIIGIEREGDNQSSLNKVKSSNFFFSSEDEEEVSELTKKLGTKDQEKEVNDEKVNSLIDEVIFDTGVSFSSSELSERFINVLRTYARNVRNRIDTKLTLVKDVDKGGLGMSDGRAEEVLKSLDKRNKKKEELLPELTFKSDSLDSEAKKESIESKPNIDNFRKKLGESTSENTRDMAYDLSSMPKKVDTPIERKLDLGKIELKVDSKGLSAPIPIPIPKPAPRIDNLSLNIPLKAQVNSENIKLDDVMAGRDGKFKPRVVAPDSGKKRVEDVKVIPRLMGPIDELRYMNVVDFRRLDADPLRAVAKIKEKIDLLEEDGYSKKLEGISAWRESKVNMEYIDIGRKSIGQKKPINEIINDKKLSGHETLRESEFEAVLKLNREIRF